MYVAPNVVSIYTCTYIAPNVFSLFQFVSMTAFKACTVQVIGDLGIVIFSYTF